MLKVFYDFLDESFFSILFDFHEKTIGINQLRTAPALQT